MPETDRSGRTPAPTLVAVAHGTRDPAGIAALEALLAGVRALRPGLAAELTYLEVAEPSVHAVVRKLTGPLVVVPLLLSTGYHLTVDVPRATAVDRPDATEPNVRIAAELGPHPRLAEALRDRLGEAGWRPGDAVVLAAAGSSDPTAARATEAQAEMLADLVQEPVRTAYASAANPTVPAAVESLRAGGAHRVAIATYLLAPGHFHARLAAAGADLVGAPLGDHEAVRRLVLLRYDEARDPSEP